MDTAKSARPSDTVRRLDDHAASLDRSDRSPVVEPEALPEAIGKYRPIGRLGNGAMGVVYKCSQPGLERPVAVKVMIAGRHASPEQIHRFQREAWAAAQLDHPNVLRVYDVGSEGPLHYFIMEYVDGWSLDQLIGTQELTLDRSLRLVGTLARALQAAHERGIIHRDIKPSNILIQRASGQPKLADFGLAKSLHDQRNLSGSGDLIGTPQYMSPEQALEAPQDVDARTDVYSLGAVLYEMLTGVPPFDGPSILAVLRKLSEDEPTPVRERSPNIPEPVEAICRRAMARDRGDRFATAGEFAEAIESCLHGQPAGEPAKAPLRPAKMPSSRPTVLKREFELPASWRRALMIAAVAVGAVVVTVLLLRSGPTDDLVAGRSSADPEAELASPGPAVRAIAPAGQTSSGSPANSRAIDPVDRSLAVAREVLQTGGALNLARTATPRDRLKALIEDLNATLKRVPEQSEILLQRARAHRRAGNFLSAINDLGQVIRRDPQNTAAVAERLLASYQLRVLYLGNLNEKALRPIGLDWIRDDASSLDRRGNPTQKHVAALAVALAGADHTVARRLAEAGPPGSAKPGDMPDVRMLEADALFHAAQAAYAAEQAAEGAEKESKQRERQNLVNLASTALRRGLDADPNHVGLLFLQADTFQRLAVWDTTEDGDRASMIRRQRRAFEAALDHLRTTCMMGTCESAVAWTVLLSNFDRFDRALERVDDALACNPTIPYLHAVKAWLRLQAPPDGSLTSEEVAQILGDFQAAFKSPPEDYNSYFVRALLHATAGNWEAARHDLRTSRRKLPGGVLPSGIAAYNTWMAQADPSLTRYLDATSEVLNYLAVPVEVRISLSEAVLKRLGDSQGAAAEGLADAEVKTMKGWTHVRLAAAFAAKNDKAGVLEHARLALELRLADLTPKTFTDDATFAAWNADPEFTELYKRYQSNGGS